MAFLKLKQLCVNEPFEKWLSLLENSCWLKYVRNFLKHSAELVGLYAGQQTCFSNFTRGRNVRPKLWCGISYPGDVGSPFLDHCWISEPDSEGVAHGRTPISEQEQSLEEI